MATSPPTPEAIREALQTLYSGDLPDKWMTTPNAHPLFAGRTPAEYAEQHGHQAILDLLNGWLWR